jgi:type IV secretory pathway component VirB8
MEGDISVELLEEWDSIANQDRQDRITNFVCQPETQTFAGDYAAPNKPDGTEPVPQVPIHELRKVA